MEDFCIDKGLHQGLDLRPFLFTSFLDELTKCIQDKVSWYMLFVDVLYELMKLKTALTIS